MSVLVTGGAGYIGSHMVLALREQGEEVVVLDNLSTGFRWALPADVPLVTGDLADDALVDKTIKDHGVKSIAHFAAKIVVPESVADPLGYYLGNTVRTRSLLASAVRNGVENFIFSSTAAVYGNPPVMPVPEDVPLQPVSPYGRSKLMSEWMLQDTAFAHGLKYVVLRYFNVAGADPGGRTGQSTPAATHLIKVACQAALGLRPQLEVFGTDYDTPDGSCLRDYIQVSDLAQAHVAALAHLRAGGDNLTLNCGYGRGYSVLEVVEAVKRVSGIDIPVVLSPRRPGDPAAIVAEVARIKATLDWNPQFQNLDMIVSQALAWEKRLANHQAA
ncbi:UDP-glucose 4-epimerase GalE [Chelatococcus asaccharovorans]|uniref:UDP-glucose 4-epimerase n=1 Tax=Chelatococcus asaccharovorans TaxID=28210 RepID=A0A2V3U3V7_9HYPH|nr:UDP-glucose 4-epimerase GalE [Chelatococcus asaccharovorans]MBS7704933.1 UDP-glucose 4-epimerase GalE [Chelatococcus asaccharovorans]PXW51847.1 UDP-glucose 4-epimerase [Chelatococcus asaccharovorans]CAH1651273.1 UDP-glucose 4-epimerase [Chelatococcus asaccharovorans]CAH1686644.1 UDP-glucose 4-epimerase [Chelatococcus asaccharovorans]